MTERVALTGATGFVGSHILAALEQSGYRINALTRRPRADSESISWINGALDSPAALAALVQGSDSIIHCAGATRGNSLQDFVQVNVAGTQNLLNAARNQSRAPGFLLISSLAARYPDYSWYARSKALAEALLMADEYSALSRTIYRPTAVYGPGDREMRPLFRLMRRGLLAGTGAPDARLSLIHVADLVSAIMMWLRAPATQGVFELDDGAPGGYRWTDIAAIGEAVWQRRITHIRAPARLLRWAARANLLLARTLRYRAMLTPGKVNELTHDDWVCDNTPLTTCLGWKPQISLGEGLDTAL